MRSRAVPLVVLVALAATGCLPGGEVVRVSDGREVRGPWISPESYAAYLDGTLSEASGDAPRALVAYEAAVREDPGNGGAWARLGVVACKSDPARATRALARARAVAPGTEAPWLAAAECHLLRSEPARAARAAKLAVRLAPDDVEATLVLAAALDRSGDGAGARRWLLALTLFRPASTGAARALTELAERSGDTARARLAAGKLRAALEEMGAAPGEREDALSHVRAALGEGDARGASAAAVSAGMSSAELAVLATERSRPEVALQIARRVLAADPGNADARIAAVASSDLVNDEESLRAAAVAPHGDRTPPSSAAAALLADLLSRRVGPEAARLFREASGVREPAATPDK